MLSKVTEPIAHANWSTKLSEIEFGINNSVHATTKETPSKLLFGVNQRGVIIDQLTEYLEDKTEKPLYRNLNDKRLKAVDGIRKSQDYSAKYFKKHSRPPKIYSVGDYVVIRQKHNPIGKGKLSENYRGPYVITKVLDNDRYVVEDI